MLKLTISSQYFSDQASVLYLHRYILYSTDLPIYFPNFNRRSRRKRSLSAFHLQRQLFLGEVSLTYTVLLHSFHNRRIPFLIYVHIIKRKHCMKNNKKTLCDKLVHRLSNRLSIQHCSSPLPISFFVLIAH